MSAESAYELADRLHAAGMEAIDGVPFYEQRDQGVYEATFNPNGTEKLHADGVIDGRKAYQTFSRGKGGNIYLWTVFVENDGHDRRIGHRFTPTGDGSPESIAALGASFFAQRLG